MACCRAWLCSHPRYTGGRQGPARPRLVVVRSPMHPGLPGRFRACHGPHVKAESLNSLGPWKPGEQEILAQCPELQQVDPEVWDLNVRLVEGLKLSSRALLLRQPRLFTQRLSDWWDFFEGYGFSQEQFKHILMQSPESLASATLVTAGMTMMHLKGMGLDEYGIKQMCCYYPQVLHMDAAQVQSIVKLIANHQSTHGC